MVKEADALSQKGYDVTVLYQFWNKWGTEMDVQLLKNKTWKSLRVGGAPDTNPFIYWYSRIVHKLFRSLASLFPYSKKIGFHSIGRCTAGLTREAKKIKADLYIAHNLAALPAVVKAADFHKTFSGFDAEDFHRFEVNDNPNSHEARLNILIEDDYIPKVNYMSASSPLIASAYDELFNKNAVIILNVFEKRSLIIKNNLSNNLKLFWFSQTIGPNRGLENVIEALNISANSFELHLLGEVASSYQEALSQLLLTKRSSIHFHKPIAATEIFDFASQFDIGLATEPGFSRNNNFALSNKIFTYIQIGLATIASNTPAQLQLLSKFPAIGKLFANNSPENLAKILDCYYNDRLVLLMHKTDAYRLGQTELNWEIERNKITEIVGCLLRNEN